MRKKKSEPELDTCQALAVYQPGRDGRGTVCCGFIYPRRERFEAYDRDTKSLGLYSTQAAAADAVVRGTQR
jgi:hypothetical protein